ncbi:MAG TPA: ABC transporter permease [Candidatus Eisenbacteria bacterium]|nr:ABC transporter permease [Candidatus Eisenbacteria bacterium]
MWAYIVRRLLLMVPTLFLISLLNFAIINLAPAKRPSNIRSDTGELDTSASMEAKESEHIFRQTFYLDRPIFWNTRYALTDEEILWLLATPTRPWEIPKERKKASDDLDDYGRVIVPHLIRLATLADSGRATLRAGPLQADYKRRWHETRDRWIAAGRTPGQTEWPPPPEPPAFDDALCERLLSLALDRIGNNAPRRPVVVYGAETPPETMAYNREVREEQRLLRLIITDGKATLQDKLARWKEWYEARKAEWEYSFTDKVRVTLTETRFYNFWRNLVHLDLGTSYTHRKKVWDLIAERMQVSLTLSLGSLLLAYLISLPLGILSAVTHRSPSDVVITVLLFALYSFPTIFLGVLLVIFFGIDLKWFPVSGFQGVDHGGLTVLGKLRDTVWHVVLPMATLTVGSLAYYSRFMKAGLLEVVREDYVRTARAKGLSEFVVVVKHAVRNSLIPIITLLGASLPVLIGGSIVVEFIFEIDGMGKLALEAVTKRDYAVIMGENILAAVLTMVGVFLADLAYAVVDPRISYK